MNEAVAVDPCALAAELVRIPSESGSEEAAAAHLFGVFKGLGWEPRLSGKNLWTQLGSEGPLLLLNSHTDTVPVGEGWTREPLAGRVEGGRLYGRGANDAKGCLAAMVCGAARAFAGRPFRGRVIVAATCEEEVSGKGLEALIQELPRPDAAVIGEPTGLAPAVAQKGLVLLEIHARGRSAHAAWGGGENAILKAARDALAVSELAFEREHPVLGRTTAAVTQVSGGKRHNVIPDLCTLVVDVRTTPAYSPEEIVARVQAVAQGEVRLRSSRLKAKDVDPAHPIVAAALAASPGAKPFGSPTLSDWAFLDGVPAVKVGPGDSRRSHTPDEYVELSELEAGAAFYERLIRAYFERTA